MGIGVIDMAIKEQGERSLMMTEMLVAYIKVNVPAGTLYYSFGRCYIGENWGNSMQDLSVLFLSDMKS